VTQFYLSLAGALRTDAASFVQERMMSNTDAQATAAPKQKVLAATGGTSVASAISVIVLWGFDSLGSLPDEVKGAVCTVVIAINTFLAGYYTSLGSFETNIVISDESVRSAMRIG
jgi:hypothetical protein